MSNLGKAAGIRWRRARESNADGLIRLGDDGQPHRLENSLLIRWDEVRYLDFYDA